ncbi:MAG: peptidyl-prolyl cis-trans isomerase [Gemmataceae bacterium]
MRLRTLRTSRLFRGCLLASPLCLAVGCGGVPAAPEGPPPLYRPQKPDGVRQASSVLLPPTTLADGNIAVRAVAYVNNSPIFENELRDQILQHAHELSKMGEAERAEKLKSLQKEELERLIEREAIMEEATARLKKMRPKLLEELQREADKEYEKRVRDMKTQLGAQTDEQFRDMLTSQGMSLDSIKRQVERSFMAMEYAKNMILPKIQGIPLSDLREHYDQNPQLYTESDRVKWQAIFVDAGKFADRDSARRYAEQVVAKLRGGADFAAAAKELRAAGVNALLGDDGVGEKPGEIHPAELEPTLMRLRQGEVGGPVELPGGFHVVRVAERSFAGRKPFNEKLQNEIRHKLQSQVWEREYHRMAEELKAKAVIQRVGS